MTDFAALGLAAPILQALAEQGYASPTPIQAQAIPSILAGRDLLGIAQTGTGKTAAFALPILHQLVTNKRPAPRGGCRVLVLSPTRELASQIAENFRSYGRHLNLSVAVVFGGVAHAGQVRALSRGLDVLVATPGRLVDHIDARVARLSSTEFLVLDEVDQMLDLGFIKPIRRVVRELSARRQNLFFSATMPTEIGELAGDLLSDPIKVSVAPVATTVERVRQQVLLVDGRRKRDHLVGLFADEAMKRTIVFTRTKRGADRVAEYLAEAGIAASAIHGNKSQNQRERSLLSFRSGAVRALVATDIAARGIDVDSVSHVVNFDLPEVAESYVHRIGRTARAGAEGVAISLCASDERDLLRAIEKLTRLRLPVDDRRAEDAALVGSAPAAAVADSRPARRGGPGKGAESGARRSSGGAKAHGHAGAPGGGAGRSSRPAQAGASTAQPQSSGHHAEGAGHRPARRPAAANGGGRQQRQA